MNDTPASGPRVALPAPPQRPAPFKFPVVAATVPVVASVAIWLITGSTFALIFAALGPLAATGSYIDSRVSARSLRKAERSRFAVDSESTLGSIQAFHRRELLELAEKTPSAIMLVKDAHTDAARWMGEPADSLPVHLGYGLVRSTVAIDRTGAQDAQPPEVEEMYRSLTTQAEYLNRAPIAVNARLGIVIFGNRLMALALARALAIQLARTLAPTASWVRFGGAFLSEAWAEALPHRQLQESESAARASDPATVRDDVASVHWGRLGESNPGVTITVVTEEQQAPSGHRIVIRARGNSVAVVRHPDRHQRRDFEPSFLGREQALEWVRVARDIAARDGLASALGDVPDSVQFSDVTRMVSDAQYSRESRRRSLSASPAMGSARPVMLDLVVDGPHAIVGGTTGSGKSELLIAWVLAMAAETAPEDVTFLLVDFKGGSAFASLAQLPHTVGIITDLDASTAARAFSSLRAELRHRERALAQAQVRDISDLSSVPRLVIVVDEFAAMMGDYPQLHTLFSDIAARGRSLGVHLILCTQRPSGVVRDSLLANADLRLSLRVNNGADSSAVIGNDKAAELPAQLKGRAWVAHGSSSAELAQFALVGSDDIRAVAERWSASSRPRRPWCEPLAEHISLSTLLEHEATSGGERGDKRLNDAVVFGMTDLPDEQRQGVAHWSPSADGHLLVLGASSSGKSTVLNTLAQAASTAVQIVGTDPATVWDGLTQLYTRLDEVAEKREAQPAVLVIIDDLDATVARFDEEYRPVVLERMSRILREGAACGIVIVATAQRITAAVQPLTQLFPQTLRLRFASKNDFVLSGGHGEDYDDALPQGGGLWQGARVQVAQSDRYLPVADRAAVAMVARGDGLAVVSSRPAVAAAACEAAGWSVRLIEGPPGAERELLVSAGGGRGPVALIGSVDDWQSRWGAIQSLQNHATVLFDACSLSDFRQLARTRELPPPLTPGAREFWRVNNGVPIDRVQLPSAHHLSESSVTQLR
ncbi:cell division protein [Salinibacterium sp. UTAS2018]|uniref:FtsK/SpoIIIE domain-containing protein n=1 Tax=Salinibacterium sp. UTAS2018 TaxID=2508880 RepID=UPI0010096290|nr:FtsK/SpoIIIE domain-containing protein [Salinibacterium sp. UTAS2018]QAV69088.1 cell division protein [Salinibacterium sp. UTAS2018]